jgi:CheY-like chemotaxis protein
VDDPTQRTILVVEDIGEISSQMEAMLHRKGHRVVLASDAEEAIKIAEINLPALILTDMDLPTFDSLVQGIRAHQTLNKVVVVIIDINDPMVNARSDVKVVGDFTELDALLASMRPPIVC